MAFRHLALRFARGACPSLLFFNQDHQTSSSRNGLGVFGTDEDRRRSFHGSHVRNSMYRSRGGSCSRSGNRNNNDNNVNSDVFENGQDIPGSGINGPLGVAKAG